MVAGTDIIHGIRLIHIGAILLIILTIRITTTTIQTTTTITHIIPVKKLITTMVKGAQAAPTLIAQGAESAHRLAKLTLAVDKQSINRQQ